MPYSLNINGRSVSVSTSGDTPLLWVLRDTLGMVGTKYGCGVAQCGACTVHLNGSSVRSCQLPLESIPAGSSITTIEGLAASRIGERLQRAWIELDVAQCGYCQAGQLMSAAALLAASAKPTDGEIDAAMAGNLCRCATYLRIRAAIRQATGRATASKEPGNG